MVTLGQDDEEVNCGLGRLVAPHIAHEVLVVDAAEAGRQAGRQAGGRVGGQMLVFDAGQAGRQANRQCLCAAESDGHAGKYGIAGYGIVGYGIMGYGMASWEEVTGMSVDEVSSRLQRSSHSPPCCLR